MEFHELFLIIRADDSCNASANDSELAPFNYKNSKYNLNTQSST